MNYTLTAALCNDLERIIQRNDAISFTCLENSFDGMEIVLHFALLGRADVT